MIIKLSHSGITSLIFRVPILSLIFSIVLLLVGCATTELRIHYDVVPDNSLRIAQILDFASRDEILQRHNLYKALIASGISDEQIVDESIAAARIYCCGGITKKFSAEIANATMIYIPKDMTASVGDMIEVKVGGFKDFKTSLVTVNLATRVVQKLNETNPQCWWDPKDNRLWQRVIYCDWMPRSGWVKQGGITPAWYKPPSIKSD